MSSATAQATAQLHIAKRRIRELTEQRDALLDALEHVLKKDALTPQELAIARMSVLSVKAVIAATEGSKP